MSEEPLRQGPTSMTTSAADPSDGSTIKPEKTTVASDASACTTPMACFRVFLAHCAAAVSAGAFYSRVFLASRIAALVRLATSLPALGGRAAIGGIAMARSYAGAIVRIFIAFIVGVRYRTHAPRLRRMRQACLAKGQRLTRAVTRLLVRACIWQLYHQLWLPAVRWLLGQRNLGGSESDSTLGHGGGDDGDLGYDGDSDHRRGWRRRLRPLALVATGILLDRAAMLSPPIAKIAGRLPFGEAPPSYAPAFVPPTVHSSAQHFVLVPRRLVSAAPRPHKQRAPLLSA